MSAVITAIIPPRGFELIRNQIGSIVAMELQNQLSSFAVAEAECLVTVEGSKIVDSTELSTIIVALEEGNYDSMHLGSVRATYRFNVDVHCMAKTDPNTDGGIRSSFKCQRLGGLVHAILQDAFYVTLGFADGFIQRSMVSKLKVGDPNTKDALSTTAARLFVDVWVCEETPLVTPQNIQGFTTTVNIGTTSSGYVVTTTI